MADELTPAERAAADAIAKQLRDAINTENWVGFDGMARTAVAAARPHIAAETLREAAEEIRAEAADTRGNGWRANETYRAQKIYARLRERADEIRGGSDAA